MIRKAKEALDRVESKMIAAFKEERAVLVRLKLKKMPPLKVREVTEYITLGIV